MCGDNKSSFHQVTGRQSNRLCYKPVMFLHQRRSSHHFDQCATRNLLEAGNCTLSKMRCERGSKYCRSRFPRRQGLVKFKLPFSSNALSNALVVQAVQASGTKAWFWRCSACPSSCWQNCRRSIRNHAPRGIVLNNGKNTAPQTATARNAVEIEPLAFAPSARPQSSRPPESSTDSNLALRKV